MNALFKKGLENFLTGKIDWLNDSISAMLITAEYSPDITNDEFLSDVTQSAIVSQQLLTGKTVSGPDADADDVTFEAVSGSEIVGLLIAQYNENDEESRLIAWLDDDTVFPITPTGENIPIQWNSNPDRIFEL